MTLRGTHNNPTKSAAKEVKGRNNGDGQRHGSAESSGADSWRSTDTVRAPFGSLSGRTTVRVNTNKKLQYVLSFFLIMQWDAL
jgi:hypothetical protein